MKVLAWRRYRVVLRAPQAGFKREIKDIMAEVEARCLEAVWLAVEDFFKRVSEETA